MPSRQGGLGVPDLQAWAFVSQIACLATLSRTRDTVEDIVAQIMEERDPDSPYPLN